MKVSNFKLFHVLNRLNLFLEVDGFRFRLTHLMAVGFLLLPFETQGQGSVGGDNDETINRNNPSESSHFLGFPYNRGWRLYHAPKNINQPLDEKTKDFFVISLNRLGDSFSGAEEYKKVKTYTSQAPDDIDWRLHHAGLIDVPKGKGPSFGGFGKYLGQNSEKIAMSDLKSRYPIERYSSLKWEFGLSNGSPPKEDNPKLAYGLILEEIRNDSIGPNYAALSDWESFVDHAPKAKVIWKVGPRPEDRLTPYPFSDFTAHKETDEVLGATDELGFVTSRLPTPRAKVALTPENFESFSVLGRDRKTSFWKLETEQVDGLYHFTSYHMADWTQARAEHRLGLPLLRRSFWLARIYDENITLKESHFKTQLRVVYNAQFAARFNHLEERWVFDVGQVLNGRYWAIIVKGKAESPKVEAKDVPENYAMNYNFKF